MFKLLEEQEEEDSA